MRDQSTARIGDFAQDRRGLIPSGSRTTTSLRSWGPIGQIRTFPRTCERRRGLECSVPAAPLQCLRVDWKICPLATNFSLSSK